MTPATARTGLPVPVFIHEDLQDIALIPLHGYVPLVHGDQLRRPLEVHVFDTLAEAKAWTDGIVSANSEDIVTLFQPVEDGAVALGLWVTGDTVETPDLMEKVDYWDHREDEGRWARIDIQIPRLLSEIPGVGLSESQWDALLEAMDLASDELSEVFGRAQARWERLKAPTPDPLRGHLARAVENGWLGVIRGREADGMLRLHGIDHLGPAIAGISLREAEDPSDVQWFAVEDLAVMPEVLPG